jgi:hypothetical protein
MGLSGASATQEIAAENGGVHDGADDKGGSS